MPQYDLTQIKQLLQNSNDVVRVEYVAINLYLMDDNGVENEGSVTSCLARTRSVQTCLGTTCLGTTCLIQTCPITTCLNNNLPWHNLPW